MNTFIAAVKVRVDQIVTQKKLNAEPLQDGEGSNYLRDASWKDGFDSFGFSALSAGYYGNYYKMFDALGYSEYFGSSTESYRSSAFSLYVSGSDAHGRWVVKNYVSISSSMLQPSTFERLNSVMPVAF